MAGCGNEVRSGAEDADRMREVRGREGRALEEKAGQQGAVRTTNPAGQAGFGRVPGGGGAR